VRSHASAAVYFVRMGTGKIETLPVDVMLTIDMSRGDAEKSFLRLILSA